ncbi:hypothetical protein [Saccharopolyspora hattusasensis]|uniref:hypothetical protein n=1 Tax=Saccharopolyspora hattusasensis TaxID=1128679 RepID=UPI003D9521FE
MTGATGFEGAAGQIGDLQQQAQGLRAAVDSGQLVMDPEAAERVAKVYEGTADKLGYRIANADNLIARNAYGDCFIGRQLEQKFADKVEHPEFGLIAIVRKAQEILYGMAQAYRDSARGMQNTDDENARNLER